MFLLSPTNQLANEQRVAPGTNWPSETPSPLTVNTNSATFRDHVGAGAISPPVSQVHSRVFHVVLETERLVLLAKESRRKVIASHGEGPRWYHRKAAMRVCPFSRVPLFGGLTGEKERQDVFLYSMALFSLFFGGGSVPWTLRVYFAAYPKKNHTLNEEGCKLDPKCPSYAGCVWCRFPIESRPLVASSTGVGFRKSRGAPGASPARSQGRAPAEDRHRLALFAGGWFQGAWGGPFCVGEVQRGNLPGKCHKLMFQHVSPQGMSTFD